MAGWSLKVLGIMGLSSYAAAYVCLKLRAVSYDRYKIVAVPADQLPEMPRGYSFHLLGEPQATHLDLPVPPEVQAERIAGGLQCLVVFDRRGAIAGVAWVGKHSYCERHLQVRFVLPNNVAWDTGLWVPEEKRMGRAFSATWAAIGEWLRSEGLDWTVSTIADYNIPSILAHRRLGARNLGHVTVLRIGRLRLAFGARPIVSIIGRSSWPVAAPKPLRAAAQAEAAHM